VEHRLLDLDDLAARRGEGAQLTATCADTVPIFTGLSVRCCASRQTLAYSSGTPSPSSPSTTG